MRMSVADQNFGTGQLVPYTGTGGQVLPALSDTGKQNSQPLSFMDLRAQTSDGASGGPNSSDILFLKRLLFLKATLDNQH